MARGVDPISIILLAGLGFVVFQLFQNNRPEANEDAGAAATSADAEQNNFIDAINIAAGQTLEIVSGWFREVVPGEGSRGVETQADRDARLQWVRDWMKRNSVNTSPYIGLNTPGQSRLTM